MPEAVQNSVRVSTAVEEILHSAVVIVRTCMDRYRPPACRVRPLCACWDARKEIFTSRRRLGGWPELPLVRCCVLQHSCAVFMPAVGRGDFNGPRSAGAVPVRLFLPGFGQPDHRVSWWACPSARPARRGRGRCPFAAGLSCSCSRRLIQHPAPPHPQVHGESQRPRSVAEGSVVLATMVRLAKLPDAVAISYSVITAMVSLPRTRVMTWSEQPSAPVWMGAVLPVPRQM